MTLLVVLTLSVFLFLLAWVILTACRIWFPDTPQRMEWDDLLARHESPISHAGLFVGAREIQEEQRIYQRQHTPSPGVFYNLTDGSSGSLPDTWRDDLWLRRN